MRAFFMPYFKTQAPGISLVDDGSTLLNKATIKKFSCETF